MPSSVADRRSSIDWLFAGLFLLTLSTLLLEILDARLLSVLTWYHLSFLAVSLAMLGMAAGAVFVFRRPERFTPERAPTELARITLWFACAVPVSHVVNLTVPFLPIATGSVMEVAVDRGLDGVARGSLRVVGHGGDDRAHTVRRADRTAVRLGSRGSGSGLRGRGSAARTHERELGGARGGRVRRSGGGVLSPLRGPTDPRRECRRVCPRRRSGRERDAACLIRASRSSTPRTASSG